MKYILALCFFALATNVFASETIEDKVIQQSTAFLQAFLDLASNKGYSTYSIDKVLVAKANKLTKAVYMKADLKKEEITYKNCDIKTGQAPKKAKYLKLKIDCLGQDTFIVKFPKKKIFKTIMKNVLKSAN